MNMHLIDGTHALLSVTDEISLDIYSSIMLLDPTLDLHMRL